MQYNFMPGRILAEDGTSQIWSFSHHRAKHFERAYVDNYARELRQTMLAGYVQDDWRFRTNLT